MGVEALSTAKASGGANLCPQAGRGRASLCAEPKRWVKKGVPRDTDAKSHCAGKEGQVGSGSGRRHRLLGHQSCVECINVGKVLQLNEQNQTTFTLPAFPKCAGHGTLVRVTPRTRRGRHWS